MTVDTDPVFTAAVKLPDAKTKRLDFFFWRDFSCLSSFFQKSVFLHFLYSNSTTHTDQTHTHKHRFCMDLITHFLAPYANLNYHCCVLSLILFQTNSVRTWTDVLTNTKSQHNSSILQRCPHMYSCTGTDTLTFSSRHSPSVDILAVVPTITLDSKWTLDRFLRPKIKLTFLAQL